MDSLKIGSPKRKILPKSSWSEFFPYYAGFPVSFAKDILASADLPKNALIFDPWNGSGTTTFSAAQLGFKSAGLDLNPAMVIVAKARMLSPSEADSIEPQARSLVKNLKPYDSYAQDDSLSQWFDPSTAATLRAIERRIRKRLIGNLSNTSQGINFEKLSGFACTFYVALFSICRDLTLPYRSSNPTWLRIPKSGEEKIYATPASIVKSFVAHATNMANTLEKTTLEIDYKSCTISSGSTLELSETSFADFILTSPPYCTRIDYTAATRIELSILSPLLDKTYTQLSREMIGSTKVPSLAITPDQRWGKTCINFLESILNHTSKASSGYYYKTHLDYFNKMSISMNNIANSLKNGGRAVMVVQDSYYKDIHNNLPAIFVEMASNADLNFIRKEDFYVSNTFSGINPNTKKYRASASAVESVLCFAKSN